MLEFLSRRNKDVPAQESYAQDNDIVIEDGELEDIEAEVLEFADYEQQEVAPDSELEDLMGAIKQQSVDLSCDFAAFANLSAQIETLSSRAATLQPMLKGLVDKSKVPRTCGAPDRGTQIGSGPLPSAGCAFRR